MDWLTFVVEITRATAWPLVAVCALLVFRPEWRSLLQRIRRGKVGGAEFEFDDRVATLRERVGEADPTAVDEVPAELARRAAQDPRSVVLQAWLGVQSTVQAVVARHGTADDLRDSSSVSLRVLHRVLRDKPEYIDTYNELKMLRHQAVHDPVFAPRPGSVVEYAQLAAELSAVLAPYAET